MIFDLLIFTGMAFAMISLLIILINMIFGPFLKRSPQTNHGGVSVSILIPARNEEGRIGRCLESLVRQDHAVNEILVLDDGSQDRTAEEVKKFSQVTLVTGKPLPAGWLGKNWACRQLADRAAGDILIFTDADTWHESDAVSRTLDWMTAKNLDMLSAFPRQIMRSFAERVTIPFIDLILFSLLPLWLTYYGRSEKFAAANGQWIAFRRKIYDQMGGHTAVRDKVVEDVELARLVKRSGGRILTTSGKDVVYCRMYENFSEIRSGFEKNLFGLTGNQPVLFLFLIVLFAVGYIFPLILVFIPQTAVLAGLTLLVQVLIRFSLALTLKHDVLVNVLLAPITVLIGMYIGISSFYKSKKGKIVWKGRQINSRSEART